VRGPNLHFGRKQIFWATEKQTDVFTAPIPVVPSSLVVARMQTFGQVWRKLIRCLLGVESGRSFARGLAVIEAVKSSGGYLAMTAK
jgi:hypothetical protein